MLSSLMNAWRSLRGRRRLDVLDVIAEVDPATDGHARAAHRG
jgi:hypothetical protein